MSQAHGYGVLFDFNPNKRQLFEGNWVQGEANGKGRLISKEGDIYEGEILKNSAEGTGILKFEREKQKGDLYEGNFKKGIIHGKGVY